MASSTGSKYNETKEMSLVQVARLVRKDIAAAKKSGGLPEGLRVSVRVPRSTATIHVEASGAPFRAWSEFGLTEDARRLSADLGLIVGQYNSVYYEDPYSRSERFGSCISINEL